ncbi:hypothetical protein TNCV_2594001 [Trichonephila clavipes]|nr:hypothetical protein TNCV_2594001 [Trichonephila clavipes]
MFNAELKPDCAIDDLGHYLFVNARPTENNHKPNKIMGAKMKVWSLIVSCTAPVPEAGNTIVAISVVFRNTITPSSPSVALSVYTAKLELFCREQYKAKQAVKGSLCRITKSIRIMKLLNFCAELAPCNAKIVLVKGKRFWDMQ